MVSLRAGIWEYIASGSPSVVVAVAGVSATGIVVTVDFGDKYDGRILGVWRNRGV